MKQIFLIYIYAAEIIILIETNELKATLLIHVASHCGKPSTFAKHKYNRKQLLRGDLWAAQIVLLIALYLS